MKKVLTIQEPFASFIMQGDKKIETRSWKTNYRGELYIHAGKSKKFMKILDNKTVSDLISKTDMNFGKIICKANLIDCILMDSKFVKEMEEKNLKESELGIYEIGRYAWVFDNVMVLEEPVVANGSLNIWNFKDEQNIDKLNHFKKNFNGIDDMNLKHLKTQEEIAEGIKSLTGVFIGEYPYYSEWILKKQHEFASFEKEVIAIIVNNCIVGYAMIHHSSSEYIKINGIYIFQQFEGRGYATKAINMIIDEIKQIQKKYVLIQTRLHNVAVAHMFDKIGFKILGNNYHEIEKMIIG